MASTLRPVFQFSSQIISKRLNFTTSSYHTTAVRCLFSDDSLGISNFLRQRSHMQEKVGNLREAFRDRMEEYMESSNKNTIFTDDLKTIIHIAENQKELETALKMMRRYHLQGEQLRFSNFHFGPLIMRMLHVLRKPDEALQVMTDEEMTPFFRNLSTVNAFVDLLFEEGCYNGIIDVTPTLRSQLQLIGARNTSDLITIYAASCLKLNTRESYDLLMNMLTEMAEKKESPSLRAVIYAAKLALSQGEVQTAFELMGLVLDDKFTRSGGNPPIAYTTVKAMILSRLGRVQEALQLVSQYVNRDTSETTEFKRPVTVFPELIEELESAVEKSRDEVLKSQLSSLKKQIERESYLTKQTFDDYIFIPIVRKRQMQDGYRRRQRSPIGGFQSQSGQRSYRPSLTDSEEQMKL